jgi:hypothetical protein
MMTCNLTGLLNNAAGILDDSGVAVGGYAFALRELAGNLRELKERTDKGDMTALTEFFAVYKV